MATVAAIFDDSVALERAVGALEKAGLGADIAEVSENRDADVAPEQTETPDAEMSVPPLAGAGGVLGSGGIGAQGSAPLLGGLFGTGGSGIEGRLDALGSAAEPFRLAAKQGGKLIFLETGDADKAVHTLKQAGAQQVYDPR